MNPEHPTVTIGAVPMADLADLIHTTPAPALRTKLNAALAALRTHDHWLTLAQFIAVTRHFANVELADNLCAANSAIVKSCIEVHQYLGAELERYDPATGDITFRPAPDGQKNKRLIYGVNTGFGSARNKVIETGEAATLSENILYSHATGVGKPLSPEVVRGMILLRLRTFAQGCSGVRPIVLYKLVELLNKGVIPLIPEKGSVGSSGDLAPLSHLFLVLIGKGKAWIINDPARAGESIAPDSALAGADALKQAGIEPLKLSAKDGLALTNGATLSAAMLALAVHDAEQLYHSANISGAISLQAVCGHTRALEPLPHSARPHLGQILAARELCDLLQGSTLVDRVAALNDAQDDYSIRAMPQVHGAALTAILHTREIAETEINSVTDNPLFFGHLKNSSTPLFLFNQDHHDPDKFDKILKTTHCSAANFHGEPIGIALDYLKIAVAELANIAERRIQLLLDKNQNRGLPANLTNGKQGLHSGLMLTQYTAAALVSENKVLCHPSSVDSIPTSANAEDHVAMATNAARHTRMVIENTTNVLAIELLCALQAVDLRIPAIDNAKNDDEDKNSKLRSTITAPKLSPRTQEIHHHVRSTLNIPCISVDSANDPATPSFKNNPPSDLIQKLAHHIINRSIHP
jgi:histidine ammonia-lyase